MAPKSAYEEDYKIVFAPFGTLVDIYVIRDRNGFSKGCAFVKYEYLQSARDAIDALHDKYIMPGGFRTLVVTIADDRRGPHSAWHSGDTGVSVDGYRAIPRSPGIGISVDSSTESGFDWRGRAGSSGPIATPQAAYSIPTPPMPPSLVPGMPYLFCAGNPPQGTYVYYPHVPSSSHQTSGGTGGAGNALHTFCLGASAVRYDGRADRSLAAIGSATRDGPRGAHKDIHGGDLSWEARTVSPEEEGRRWAKQPVGPAGANLFVYYLPGSVSDADLATVFAPFGEVLSAKVYYDRDTGESKGFGAYDG